MAFRVIQGDKKDAPKKRMPGAPPPGDDQYFVEASKKPNPYRQDWMDDPSKLPKKPPTRR